MSPENETISSSFLSRNKVYIILHLLGWIILFIFPAYLLYLDSNEDTSFLIRSYLQVILYALVFYATTFYSPLSSILKVEGLCTL